MDDGYALALGSVYQGGSWDHDDDTDTPMVPAVFKSTNNGSTWSRYAMNSQNGYVYSIVVHPTSNNTVFAGGRYRNAGNYWVSGLFKTTNGGLNWNEIGASLSAGSVRELKFDPFNANKMYAGTDQGVYMSTNGGTNWQSPSRTMGVECISLDPTSANRLFAGTWQGVYTSTNGGSSWTEMNNGLFDDDVNCMDFDATNGVLYVGTNGGGVFRSSVGTGIDDEPANDNLPTDCILYQNYPNPFNMGTEIQYQLESEGSVKLTIFDINGRIVRHLVDMQHAPGIHRIFWDGKDNSGEDLASGLYIYKIRTKDQTQMKKMVLQK